MLKMLRLKGLTEYWEGLSDKIWNVEDDGTSCDILIKKGADPKVSTKTFASQRHLKKWIAMAVFRLAKSAYSCTHSTNLLYKLYCKHYITNCYLILYRN